MRQNDAPPDLAAELMDPIRLKLSGICNCRAHLIRVTHFGASHGVHQIHFKLFLTARKGAQGINRVISNSKPANDYVP